MDSLHDALAAGQKCTRCRSRMHSCGDAAIEVDTSLLALCVVRVLEKLRLERGLPQQIVFDNGTEFTSKAMDQWV